jgi:hypothetical protein
MKAELKELNGCFSLDIEPETMEEQVALARLAINRTKNRTEVYVDAYSDNVLTASIIMSKKSKPITSLCK